VKRRKFLFPLTLLVALPFAFLVFGAFSPAWAGSYPGKPIRIIVPYPPGGAADTIARIYGEPLAQVLKQAIIIENKPGAGTAIAAESVARAKADGHTLLLAVSDQLAVLPHLKKVQYDPLRDFAPVTVLAAAPSLLIAARPGLSPSLEALVALAKKEPGKLTYSTYGAGSASHLIGEFIKNKAGIDLLHVPYKGSAPAIQALLAGEVDISIDTVPILQPHIRAGKLKLLATTGPTRAPEFPEAPTVAEGGVPGFSGIEGGWYAVVAPAHTSTAIVQQLAKTLAEIGKRPEIQKKLAEYGVTARPNTPDEFSRLIRDDFSRWAQIVGTTGVTLD
jgi:tripartite-type tricarboxylate transporter receptor subunit TctC